MKKMIIYGIDRWMKELVTLSRFEKIAYFIDDEQVCAEKDNKLYFGESVIKSIYPIRILLKENRDDLVIIISNSRNYKDAANKLTEMGFIENIHFFNGWKLDGNFYKIIDANQEWKADEKNTDNIFENKAWEKRAEIMASMIPGDVRSVMDLGCGDCKLKKYLSKGIKYIGLDYCQRSEDTIVCDMNKEQLPMIDVDMYYLAGVLPYINDKEALFKQMKNGKYILLSAYPMEQFIRLDGHVANVPSFFFQNYSNDDMVNYLYKEGFVLVQCMYDYKIMNAHFYLFQKLSTV